MFYRINMTDLSVKSEEGEQYQGLGGRALTSRIVETEVDPSAHPLGDKNKLVFASSLLSGTGAPNAMNNNNDMMDDDRMSDMSNRQVQRYLVIK